MGRNSTLAEQSPETINTTAPRIDVDPLGSTHKGFSGFYEALLRRSKTLIHALTMIPLYCLASFCVGLALVPATAMILTVWERTSGHSALVRYPSLAFAISAGFFLFGFSLTFLVPLVNFVMRAKLVAWRGPYYSLAAVKWYIHNGLTYLVRYTFLEFITPTPFNLLFFRAMGMRIGRDCQLNSAHISDPSMIELGDRVTIGGSATIIGHYGMGGYLVMAPVKIGSGATIGLKATVMGGAEIGEGAKIMPNSVVLPKTKVPAGETWGGVPAQKIERLRPSRPAGKPAKAAKGSRKKAA